MKTHHYLFLILFLAVTSFLNIHPCAAQCSLESTFIDPHSSTSTPISLLVVGVDPYGDEIKIQIDNTGSDTLHGNIWFKEYIVDETHQLEILNSYLDLSRVTPNGYLAPGEATYYYENYPFEAYINMGFNPPYHFCFEIYDSTTNETCNTACLLLTDCDGERVINITRDYKCQNQPYDFFGQPITEEGTYHHYDTIDGCITHYILHFTCSFIFPQPTVTISGDTTFCEGGETTLTANNSFYNNSPNFNLQWSNGNTTPSIHITTGGTWSVTASYFECTASKSITVNVMPVPEIQLSGDLQHCDGTPVELYLTTEEGADILWSDGSSGNQFITDQSGNYSVTVTGENGCVNTHTFDAAVGFPTQSEVSLTANCYFILNGTVYSQSGDYLCVIPNALGCDSVINLHLTIHRPWDAMIYYDTTCMDTRYTQHGLDTVFYHAGDYAFPLSSTSALQLHVIECTPNIICSGEMSPCGADTVILTVDREATSYHWNTGANTPSIMVTQAGYYAVTITNSHGCELSSDYIHVGASNLLSIPPEFCMVTNVSDGSIRMSWNETNANAVAYKIYKMKDESGNYIHGAIIPKEWGLEWAENVNTNQYTWTYRISAIDSCGRESEWSDPVSPMHLSFDITHTSIPIIHLQWTPYIGAEVSRYRIIHNNSEETTTELYYDIPYVMPYNIHLGSYVIEAVIDHECNIRFFNDYEIVTYTMPQSNQITLNSVQITENEIFPTFFIYPNPASDILNIQINNLTNPSSTLEIYDVYGRLITHENCNESLLQINISDYKSGIYIIRISKDNIPIGYSKFVKK